MKNIILFSILLLPIISLACLPDFLHCIENKYICNCINEECNGNQELLGLHKCYSDSQNVNYIIAIVILSILIAFTLMFSILFCLCFIGVGTSFCLRPIFGKK